MTVKLRRGTELVDDNYQPLVSHHGGLRFSQTYSSFDEDGSFFGARIECPANTVTIHDIEITTELFVDAGKVWFVGASDGDIVEISLVDKNDKMGLFTMLGYTIGQDVLELGKWAENIPMYPGNTPWTDFVTPDVAPIVAGLFLRVKYDNNHATQDAVMGIVFSWFKSGV